MARIPSHPKIYHITHFDNLSRIIEAQKLWSDSKRIELKLDVQIVGMSRIKERRLHELEVTCHPGTKVGDYVPFYFCPRSVMLYMSYKRNTEDLAYKGGQDPIVHLQADLRKVVKWADSEGRKWAFSASNAGARYVECYSDLSQLERVNWDAVNSGDFRNAEIKEGKQAEFLVHEFFPWELVEKIGVIDAQMATRVNAILDEAGEHPLANVESDWYY